MRLTVLLNLEPVLNRRPEFTQRRKPAVNDAVRESSLLISNFVHN